MIRLLRIRVEICEVVELCFISLKLTCTEKNIYSTAASMERQAQLEKLATKEPKRQS